MNLDLIVSLFLGVIGIVALRSSPASLLALAQANQLANEEIDKLKKKVDAQKMDFDKQLQAEKDVCREKINVLANVIADLIKDKTISPAHKKKMNDKLSQISEPKITTE